MHLSPPFPGRPRGLGGAFATLVVLAAFWADAGAEQGPDQGVDAPKPTLILVPAPEAGRVEGVVALADGEPWDEASARALVGGGDVPSGELARWLAERGALLDVRAGDDELRLSFACPTEQASEVFERVLALTRAPAFAPEAFARAPSQPLLPRGLRRIVRDLLGAGAGALRAGGTPQQGDAARIAASLTARLRGSRLEAALLVAEGEQSSIEQLEALLAERVAATAPPATDAARGIERSVAPGVRALDLPGGSATLCFASASLVPASAESTALLVGMQALLGDGALERLRAELAAELGIELVLDAGFARLASRAEALLRAPAPDFARAVPAALERLRARVRELDASALDRARGRLLATEPAYGSSARAELQRAVLARLHDLPPQHFELQARALEAVRLDEVLEILERQLEPDRAALVAIGPSAAIEPALAGFGRPVVPLAATAADLVDALFDALGGREGWSNARFVELEIAHRQGDAAPARLRVWRDLDAPRMRVESQLADGSASVFVLNEASAHTRAGDLLRELPPAQHTDLVERSWRDVHCLLRRLAFAEADALRAEGARRIVIARGPARGLWIELGEDALPTSAGYATPDGVEHRFEYSDWRAFGPLVAPARIELQPDGWAREVSSLEIRDALARELFERP